MSDTTSANLAVPAVLANQRRLETALFECDGPSYGYPRHPRPVSLRESSLVVIIVAVPSAPAFLTARDYRQFRQVRRSPQLASVRTVERRSVAR
jgi:hypothetical protein